MAKWKCDWDGQQDYGLEVMGQGGGSLSLGTALLPCAHDIL